MPRIKKDKLLNEIKESLIKRYPKTIFEGSRLGFSIGDKVTTLQHSELRGLIGTVVAFDDDLIITYFPKSDFRGTRGKDLCTMDSYSFRKV